MAFQKLRKGGNLVMKTMDVSYGLKQLWISDYVVRVAQETGFELKDKFILIANKRPLHKKGCNSTLPESITVISLCLERNEDVPFLTFL